MANIKIGVAPLGAFVYDIYLLNETYEVYYTEDSHYHNMFDSKKLKLHPDDTDFIHEIKLKINQSDLSFLGPVEYKLYSILNGYFKFETPDYYAKADYYGANDDDEIHRIKVKGGIFFSCKIIPPYEDFFD